MTKKAERKMKAVMAWAVVGPKGAFGRWNGSPIIETAERMAKQRLEQPRFAAYRIVRVKITEVTK